jgi:flavorubredoxin
MTCSQNIPEDVIPACIKCESGMMEYTIFKFLRIYQSLTLYDRRCCMEAVVIYWSKTGNTRKVAFAIQEGLKEAGADAEILTVEEADNIDYFNYDLVCIGFPSHQWSPAGPMNKFLTGPCEVGIPCSAWEKCPDFLHLLRPPHRRQ